MIQLYLIFILAHALVLGRSAAATNSNLSPTVSPGNLTAPLPWHCWRQRFSRIKPADFHDCRMAAEGLQALPPHGRPWIFGTQNLPGVDYLLPMAVSKGSCKIRLLPLSDDKSLVDSFTPRYLAHQINRMSQACVQPAPHLGGEGGLGSKDVIGLAVGGFISPKSTIPKGRVVIEQGLNLEALSE